MKMPREIVVALAGRPRGKGRARSFSYVRAADGKTMIGHCTPELTRTYEGMIRTAAMDAMGGHPPMLGPVEFRLRATYPVPLSWSKKRQRDAIAGVVLPATKPDMSNIVKAWEDAMNGVVFVDDAQIVRASYEKVYGDKIGAVAIVSMIGGNDDEDRGCPDPG